jgi:sugar lactone lactonase YvrE
MITSITSGMLGTVAGSGEPGYSGDGASALNACLNEPKGIALDSEGNLYIADSENHVIRKVEVKSGVITTVAGCLVSEGMTQSSSSPDSGGFPYSESMDPLADTDSPVMSSYATNSDISGMVRYVAGQAVGGTRFGGDGGPADQAFLNFPSAIVVDGKGVLYIADTLNHRIRRVDPRSKVITTIAGTGQGKFGGDGGLATEAQLHEPVALVLFEDRLLYIADQSNNRVRMVDLSTNQISTAAGNGEAGYTGDGGAAHETGISGPSGLALDTEGNLYISDTFNGRVRKVDRASGVLETIAGDGGEFRLELGVNEGSLSLSRPYDIALDSENSLFVTDSDNHLIRKFQLDTGVVSRVAGNGTAQFDGEGVPPDQTSLNYPFGVVVDSRGCIYIADTFNHRIRAIPV